MGKDLEDGQFQPEEDGRAAPSKLNGQEFLEVPKFSGKISRASSAGPETAEVKEMIKAYNEGVPTVLYEFLQGMVDYGRMYEPPPRVTLEYKSGKRIEFDGTAFSLDGDDPIQALEFRNTGPGLAPEDLVIFRHGGGEETLGMHGRGTTIALTFLKTLGLPVKVHSNYRGQGYSTEMSLQKTDTGVTSVLHADGAWEDGQVNETVFRVENPPKKLSEMLNNIGEHFLYANPRFPGAVLVPQETSAKPSPIVRMKVGNGEVMCLRGMVKEKKYYGHLWVDGLQLPHYESAILPWSFSKFNEDYRDANGSRYWVKRGHNSRGIQSYNIEYILASVVKNLTDPDLLKRIIETALRDPEHRFLELSETQVAFAAETARLIREIWARDYEGAFIAETSESLSIFQKRFGKEQKTKIVPKGLFHFLAQAGIKTVLAEINVRESASKDFWTLHVPSAYAADNLEWLMDKLGREDLEMEFLPSKEGNRLNIVFPKALKEHKDFDEHSENNEARLLRLIAIIASVANIDCAIFGVEAYKAHEIKIRVEPHRSEKGYFSTPLTVYSSPRGDHPELAECEPNRTYVFLSGKGIEALEPPGRFGGLEEEYIKKREKIRKRLGAMPQRDPKTRRPVRRSLEEITLGRGLSKISHVSIGQIPLGRDDAPHQPQERPDEEKSIMPPGYYPQSAGTAFVYRPEQREAGWAHEAEWSEEKIPKGIPQVISSKLVATNVAGTKALLVRTGSFISGFEIEPADAPVCFFRDLTTGMYCVQGEFDKLIYYTSPDEQSEFLWQPPRPEEQEDVVDLAILPEHWANFVRDTKNRPELTVFAKAQAVAKKWEETFRYSDDDALDDQVKGGSREEVAARMFHTNRGICNISATQMALLFRAVGLPSRVLSGYWQQKGNRGGSHMWPSYWNGKRWVGMESLIGITNEGKTKRRPGKKQVEAEPEADSSEWWIEMQKDDEGQEDDWRLILRRTREGPDTPLEIRPGRDVGEWTVRKRQTPVLPKEVRVMPSEDLVAPDIEIPEGDRSKDNPMSVAGLRLDLLSKIGRAMRNIWKR